MQRPLPDNTELLQETDILVPCGIRTRNLSKRAVADWDWHVLRHAIVHNDHNTHQAMYYIYYVL